MFSAKKRKKKKIAFLVRSVENINLDIKDSLFLDCMISLNETLPNEKKKKKKKKSNSVSGQKSSKKKKEVVT